jgi:hypothetical protein
MANRDPAVAAYYKHLLMEHYQFWSLGARSSFQGNLGPKTGRFGEHALAEHVAGGLQHVRYEKELQKARRKRWRAVPRCLVHLQPPTLFTVAVPDIDDFQEILKSVGLRSPIPSASSLFGIRPLTEAQKESRRKKRAPNRFMLKVSPTPLVTACARAHAGMPARRHIPTVPQPSLPSGEELAGRSEGSAREDHPGGPPHASGRDLQGVRRQHGGAQTKANAPSGAATAQWPEAGAGPAV